MTSAIYSFNYDERIIRFRLYVISAVEERCIFRYIDFLPNGALLK